MSGPDADNRETPAEFRERVRNEPGHKVRFGASPGVLLLEIRRWLFDDSDERT